MDPHTSMKDRSNICHSCRHANVQRRRRRRPGPATQSRAQPRCKCRTDHPVFGFAQTPGNHAVLIAHSRHCRRPPNHARRAKRNGKKRKRKSENHEQARQARRQERLPPTITPRAVPCRVPPLIPRSKTHSPTTSTPRPPPVASLSLGSSLLSPLPLLRRTRRRCSRRLLPLPVSAVVNMLHHSNSRHQRNRGSKLKTLLKATVLLCVAVWLVYQVKHSYDKKNEYLNATDNQLSHDDRSMFQGRKVRVGSYVVGDVDKALENIDAISNQDEEKSGETVFEKDNTNSHDDDVGTTERSEAEEGQASRADGNAEAHGNDEDETTGHSIAIKPDAESTSSDAENKSEVHSVEDDGSQNKDAQEEIAGELNGTPHEEKEQSDGSSNADQISASSDGSDGQQAKKKEEVESQADSASLSDDTKAGTGDEHSAETLPDETGNIPAVHNENSENGASENLGDERSNSESVHVGVGSEHEGARTSSGTASGDAEKGNSVESNPSDSIFVEEKAGTATGGGEKGAEMGTTNEVSGAKEANPEEGNAATEVRTDQAANTQIENSQEASAAEGATASLDETKPVENQTDGSTKGSSNGDQDDVKIETNTSTNDEHNEHQGVDVSSGSSGSNDTGSEQTGKTETQ